MPRHGFPPAELPPPRAQRLAWAPFSHRETSATLPSHRACCPWLSAATWPQRSPHPCSSFTTHALLYHPLYSLPRPLSTACILHATCSPSPALQLRGPLGAPHCLHAPCRASPSLPPSMCRPPTTNARWSASSTYTYNSHPLGPSAAHLPICGCALNQVLAHIAGLCILPAPPTIFHSDFPEK